MNPLFRIDVRETPEKLTLIRPTWTFAARGAVLGLAGCLLGPLVALLVLGAVEEEGGIVAAIVVGGLIALAMGLVGVGMMIASPLMARRSELVADRTTGSVSTGTGTSLPLADVSAFTYQSGDIQCSLSAVSGDGVVTPLVRAGGGASSPLQEASQRLAAFTNCRLEVTRSAPNSQEQSQRTFAAACHFPVQGIFLIASVAALVISKKPFVRFNAIQSLLHFVAFALLLFVTVAVAAVAAFLLDDSDLALLVLVPFGLLVFVLAIGNLVVRVLATYWAYQGKVWVFPWLSPLIGRWAPSPLSQPLVAAQASTFE